MTWVYEQATGRISHGGAPLTTGYSGHGTGLNNPSAEQRHDMGPIPKGHYKIGPMTASPQTGTFTMVLTPMPATHVYGRSGFAIHADNTQHNHSASTGSIVVIEEAHRAAIWNSGVHELMVV